MAHTPAPWSQAHRETQDGGYRTQVFPAHDPDNTIATVHWHSVKIPIGFTTDREANARLIAAAPDLLEALNGLIEEIDDCAQPSDWDFYDASRAAIARAKGGDT